MTTSQTRAKFETDVDEEYFGYQTFLWAYALAEIV